MVMVVSLAIVSVETAAKTVTGNPEHFTKVLSNVQAEVNDKITVFFPENQDTQQSKQKLPPLFGPENVQFTKRFKMEGKQYTMYFLDVAKTVRKDKNFVTGVYFVPDDYTYISKNGWSSNNPPTLRKLTYHNLGDPENKDYYSVIVNETKCDRNGNNLKFETREILLPNDIINELVNLFSGKTKFRMVESLKNRYIEVTRPAQAGVASSKESADTRVNYDNGYSSSQNTQRSGSTQHSGHFNVDAVVDSAQVGYSWDDSQDYSNENSQDDWAIDSLKVFYEMQKQESNEFLRQNAKKTGVITLPSGLQYKVLRKGSGPIATANDMVEMNYDGRLIDGSSFDNNGSQTASFQPATLIKGLNEAITKMPEGRIWEIYVPYDLGFGEREVGSIPPFSTLIYKVEIVKVIKNGTE